MKKLVACSVVALVLVGMGIVNLVNANPTGGPISGVSRAPAFGANVHLIKYNGGEQADFAVVGDGDTTLNIIVKDQNGNVVVRTTGAGDRCLVTWRPTQTGVFAIYVVNEGNVYNQYAWRAF